MPLSHLRTARRAHFLSPLFSIVAFAAALSPIAAAATPETPPAPPSEPGRPPNSTGSTESDGKTGAPGSAPGASALNTDVPPSPGKRPENGYWSVGEPRWFVSTKSDIGTPYVKPYISAGYGLPHFLWAGVDLNSITTIEFTQVYAGVRAAAPVFDLAFGVRDTWSFAKPFVAPKNSYTSDDILGAPGPAARYWAWEAEAVGILPLPYSAVVANLIVVKTLDVPEGQYVYDESYRAVIGKPLFAVLRTAAVARVMREGALKFGPLLEHVFSAGRGQPVTRIGPALAFALTDHLEAQGVVSFVVSSPDTLGLTLGTYGVLGLRYRWASGESRPELPWRGELIP